ncbi:MAG TPA: RnfABCDGE type electron transport complex subunit D, partial [Nitrospira sp.]|nr:RnfABCDGE type electron transport complex subunit D [Nitrospira sp.]
MSITFETPDTLWRLIRFFRTPKGLLLPILALLILLAVPFQGLDQVATGLIIATTTAAYLDVAIVVVRDEKWLFPSGAILTGLIIAMVLRPQEPVYVPFAAAVIAIASKHLLRTRWSNIFNPAALALVATSLLFASGQSWWGALPDLSPLSVLLLLVLGIFMADHINKLPLALVFLGAYFGLFTLASFVVGPARVADVFRTPDLEASLFFVFFMVDDPPTCPIRYADQVVFGGIVALASVAIFLQAGGAVYYLPLGLL